MKLTEQEEQILNKIDDSITKILKYLRDKEFKNSKTRQEFAQLILRLATSKDPRGRMAIKRMGDFFSTLGAELLARYGGGENTEKVEESKIKKYKYESLFK